MTAEVRRNHLMSLNEWDAMPEDMCRRHELVDGVLQVIASPFPRHQRAATKLAYCLDEQLPDHLTAVIDVDVALKSGMRATVRRPDVVVLSVENYGDGDRHLDAADVLLVVEVVSPGSERTDRVVKPAEYARAGIAHYWLVELGDPFSLTAFELVDDVYKHVEGGTGTVELTRPVPLTFDLDALLRRR
ncbi:Uma2 family endonuclease [Lentzea sp. NEAU-D13]|uniref:Uma2 family endonuclease n=1 Tax=Lentzea alba TaxID=2714351 RepID=A0A7C9VL00_9PSEU|nr:Uma2 family endonuclease [Lentzea alba]NGY57352.1 Uma2 family endonuclease [Lentzea alba]